MTLNKYDIYNADFKLTGFTPEGRKLMVKHGIDIIHAVPVLITDCQGFYGILMPAKEGECLRTVYTKFNGYVDSLFNPYGIDLIKTHFTLHTNSKLFKGVA